MNREEIWAAYAEQKERTVDLLEQLSPEEWNQPTLCSHWTVRDLAGHLTMQGMTIGDALRTMARKPAVLAASFGGINPMIRETAKARGQVPLAKLLDQIRATITTRRANPGLTEYEALVDILIHSQDLAIPLGREISVPPAAAAVAADRIISPLRPSINKVFVDLGVSRYRLQATDIDWSSGSGPLIEGPMTGLLLLVSGRRAGLDQLSGPGADEIRHATVLH